MAQSFGKLLDPHRCLKQPFGIKGERQTIVINNNPSTIDQDQTLTVRFPNLGPHDVIVPGTVRLAFNIELESEADANRTVVNNLGRAIIRKVSVKLEGRELLCLNEANVFLTYCDLWLTTQQREDAIYQGIIKSANALKHRINAGDKTDNKKDKIMTSIFKNRFCIPLEFELIHTHAPFFPGALNEKLSYELTFNSYDQVLLSSDTNAKYQISNISLEFDIVMHKELARMVLQKYQQYPVFYQRVLHHTTQLRNKAEGHWTFSFNSTGRSIKGILMLFKKKQEPYQNEPEEYFNPQIKKLQVTIEGKPNQLFASGLLPYQHFEEAKKFFGAGNNDHHGQICKDLHLHGVRLEDFYTKCYGLWLDLRTTDDSTLHGSGRKIEGGDGIVIQIQKEQQSSEEIMVHIFVVYDAQLNISDNRLKDIIY